MTENTIYTISMVFLISICLVVYISYVYYKIRVKYGQLQVSLHLIFHDWDTTLTMWHNANKQQASHQCKDVNSLPEEVIRNLCVKDRAVRLEEVNKILSP